MLWFSDRLLARKFWTEIFSKWTNSKLRTLWEVDQTRTSLITKGSSWADIWIFEFFFQIYASYCPTSKDNKMKSVRFSKRNWKFKLLLIAKIWVENLKAVELLDLLSNANFIPSWDSKRITDNFNLKFSRLLNGYEMAVNPSVVYCTTYKVRISRSSNFRLCL